MMIVYNLHIMISICYSHREKKKSLVIPMAVLCIVNVLLMSYYTFTLSSVIHKYSIHNYIFFSFILVGQFYFSRTFIYKRIVLRALIFLTGFLNYYCVTEKNFIYYQHGPYVYICVNQTQSWLSSLKWILMSLIVSLIMWQVMLSFRGQGDFKIDYVPAPRVTEADKTNDLRYAMHIRSRNAFYP